MYLFQHLVIDEMGSQGKIGDFVQQPCLFILLRHLG